MTPDALDQSLLHARHMIAHGKEDESMPRAMMPFVFADVSVSPYRWQSLAARW